MINPFSNSELHDKVAEAVAKQIFLCSPQLFFVKHNKPKLPPYPFSSSVLVSVNGKYFLISSAHTFHEEDSESLGIMIENDFCAFGGNLRYFEPNIEGGYDPHKLDIAVFKLDIITVNAFKEKYTFLTWDKLGFKHNPLLPSRYLFFGYPSVKTQKHFPTKRIIPTSLTVRTIGVEDKYYYENNFDIRKSLLVLLKQLNASLNIQPNKPLPELDGISGCGIWNVLNLSVENPQFELVSIVTGQDYSKSILFSTRIDVLHDLLLTF